MILCLETVIPPSNAIAKIGDTWQCIFSKTIANNGAVPIKNNI